MDLFYAFLVFALVLAFELMAHLMWFGPYFRFGIPIFHKRQALTRPLGPAEAAQALEPAFHGRPEHPSIRFKVIGERTLAVREALFENRAGFRYLPVMHAALRLDRQDATAALTGYLNWYVLVTLVYIAYRASVERSFIPVAILVLFLFGLSFAAQVSLNRRVIHTLAEGEKTK
jgi:hypothetical protein